MKRHFVLPLVVLATSCSASEAARRHPWTVHDSVAMTYVQGSESGWLPNMSFERVRRSPDGRYAFFTTRRGDMECDCNVYQLHVFELTKLKSELESKEPARVKPLRSLTLRSRLATMFNGAISYARWAPDSRSIVFLGAWEDQPLQVCRFHIGTGHVEVLTDAPLGVNAFDMAGGSLIYEAVAEKRPKLELTTYPMAFVDQYDLGADLGLPDEYVFRHFASFKGATPVDLGAAIPSRHTRFWLSPNGRYAVNVAEHDRSRAPGRWGAYTNSRGQNYSSLHHLQLTDLAAGDRKPLLDAPLGWDSFLHEMLWFPSGDRVIVPNTMLPLEADLPRRLSTSYIVDFDVARGEWQTVAPIDSAEGQLLRIRWLDPGRSFLITYLLRSERAGVAEAVLSGTVFTLSGTRWTGRAALDSLLDDTANTEMALKFREGVNEPPTIVASYKGREITLMAPDPIVESAAWTKVEPIHWSDRAGRTWAGDLMLPTRRAGPVPLVLELQRVEDSFAPDGYATTALASQALAARGIAVLRIDREHASGRGAAEGAIMVEGIDSAVENLAREGLIDPDRVGAVGFSRTGWLTMYALTHPGRVRLAAAVDADGSTASYIEYLRWRVASPGTASSIEEFERINGDGRPFWENKALWMERAVGFNLDRVRAPVLLTLNGSLSSYFTELYGGLLILGKPVEYIVFPGGEHQLVRPRQRLLSMQATVDWMSFWLLGEEDSDPAKVAQYARWRKLKGP